MHCYGRPLRSWIAATAAVSMTVAGSAEAELTRHKLRVSSFRSDGAIHVKVWSESAVTPYAMEPSVNVCLRLSKGYAEAGPGGAPIWQGCGVTNSSGELQWSVPEDSENVG